MARRLYNTIKESGIEGGFRNSGFKYGLVSAATAMEVKEEEEEEEMREEETTIEIFRG